MSTAAADQGLVDVLTAAARRPWIKATIQYSLSDEGPGGYTFGLTDVRGRPKSAWYAVRGVVKGKVTKPRPPAIRLKVVGDHLEASGTASLTELLRVRIAKAGSTRGDVTLASDPRGRWKVILPAGLGTTGITVTASAGWTGTTVARR